MDAAIKTAEEGFKVSPRMAGITVVLKRDVRARDYFYLEDGETTIPEGFLRDNQPYAETLRAIQQNPRALLEGPIAEEIIRVILFAGRNRPAAAPSPCSLSSARLKIST